MPQLDWLTLRSHMLIDPSVVNLNTGSFGPLPRPVFDRVTALRTQLAAEPMDFLIRRAPPLLWQARQRLADYLRGDPNRLVFTSNVTEAINVVASGLTLPAHGEILLSDHEYRAMRWCWERAARRQNLALRTFRLPIRPKSVDEVVDAFANAFTHQTRLLFFSHVISPTGMVLPAKEICRIARQRAVLTVIDGAHAPAMIPLQLDDIHCDFYTGNCHKWLLAPTGCGFLYLGRGNERRLQPLQVSWGWPLTPDSHTPTELGSTPLLRHYEFVGTRDPCPSLTVPTAIDFQQQIGWESIQSRNRHLAALVRTTLNQVPGLRLVTPSRHELSGFMTAFELPAEADQLQLSKWLWHNHRIEVALPQTESTKLLRISTHFYNTEDEIARLGRVLADAARNSWKLHD